MDIISLRFAVLAISSIFIFYLLNPKYRTVYLTVLSYGFIATYSYYLLIYVVIYSLINYTIGIKIHDSKFKVLLFRIGIIVNISQLIILKYASFAIDPVFQLFDINLHVSTFSDIIIPIGVSYFSLQGIGYLINIKMGWEKPEKKLPDFLLYIAFFPKFLSGPVERSNHFLPQLKVIKLFSEIQVTEGLRTVLFGVFKKVAIANQLAPFVSGTYANLNSADGSSLWLLLILQPLYLYFDFSGYTDIAIGFAKTFGIDLIPNFNRPFFSENVTTFWKRFHISLSSWFNDYVFRQVSFRRKKWGIYASMYAVFMTFTLFGIWHGAGWNFMILGFLQALAINYEFFTKKWRLRLFSKIPELYRIWFGRIMTYFFFCISLVFFFSPDIKTTFTFFLKLLKVNDSMGVMLLGVRKDTFLSSLVFIAGILLIELLKNDFNNIFRKLENYWLGDKKENKILRWATYYLLFALIFTFYTNVQQFIYFQF